MTSLRSAILHRHRALLPVALGTLALTLACSSNLELKEPGNAASDPASTSSTNYAQFDPSAGVIPLPNLLLTATATTPISLSPGVPRPERPVTNPKRGQDGPTGLPSPKGLNRAPR